MAGILGSRTTCEASGCNNRARYLVNSRYREAQNGVCGVHLASTVAELATFNDPRYVRRSADHGVQVYPIGVTP